jgi:taurine dioxygenase
MSIEIIPTGAALGAEIRGVDLARPIDDETFAAIERAYNDHAVIFFRDQHITPPQQVAFTRRFGEIEFNIFGERWSVPGSPEIVVVSNVTEDGRPIGVRRAGENWHSDMCYASHPPRGTMLYALEIPELFGLALGDTEFASTAGIEGIEGREAETLIEALADHIVKPAFVYRYQWRVGDLLMWDNCVQSSRMT